MKNMVRLIQKNKWAIITILLFIFSILPILYLAPYDFASGDDLGYGTRTHLAWLSSHSMIELCRAIGNTVKQYYYGWQGTWFSVAMFSLQPEVFSPNSYFIVPYIMLMIIVLATAALLYEIFINILKQSKQLFVVVTAIFLIILIQFIPYTTSSIFWYNGAAHYTIPYGIALFSIVYSIRYIRLEKKGYLIATSVLMTLLGGCNYLAALLVPLVYMLLFYIGIEKKDKKTKFLLIPLSLEMIGLIISFLAPGNKVRGGDTINPSVTRLAMIVLASYKEGIKNVGTYCIEKPVCIVLLLFLGLIMLQISIFKEKEDNLEYSHPILFVLYMFSVYCAMYAPGLYAGTELSGGVPNTIFVVFILTSFSSMVYILNWFLKRYRKRIIGNIKFKTVNRCVCGVVVLLMMLIVLVGRGTIRNTTFFKCVTYITSGQASDYKRQMEEQHRILLDNSIVDAELPEINNEQGPLMHMPVTDNVNAFTNRVTKEFYGKNSVISVPGK